MSKKKQPTEGESISFEDSLTELEEIVASLEGGKLALADSLAAYERGVKRLKGCYEMLVAAEQRIEVVQSVDANGRARTASLDDADSADLSAKSDARSRRRTAAASPSRPDRVDDSSSLF